MIWAMLPTKDNTISDAVSIFEKGSSSRLPDPVHGIEPQCLTRQNSPECTALDIHLLTCKRHFRLTPEVHQVKEPDDHVQFPAIVLIQWCHQHSRTAEHRSGARSVYKWNKTATEIGAPVLQHSSVYFFDAYSREGFMQR